MVWAEGEADQRQGEFEGQIRPFLAKYCFDCHSGDAAEGELQLDVLKNAAEISTTSRKSWKKVHDQVFGHVMPPEDADQPSEAERDKIVAWLETTIDHYDCTGPIDPGRETIRRLTRYEYKNTIRDLLGVEAELADDFPMDDVGYGFDNIGDVLTLSPLLMEKYLAAAEQIAAAAVITDPLEATARRRLEAVKMSGAGDDRGGWRFLTTTGEFRGQIEVPANGEYIIRTQAFADQAGDELAKMRIVVDGQEKLIEVKAEQDKPADHEFRAKLNKGKRDVVIAFTNDFYDPGNRNQNRRDRNLGVRHLEIVGPLGAEGLQYPDAHRRIFFTKPSQDVSEEDAARQILRRLATRAFRRPAADSEVDRLWRLVQLGKQRGGRFEHGIQMALTAMLVSPHFLFKIEQDATPDDKSNVRTLDDYELATRLSYFLWSSMPDEELFELAKSGTLRANLEKQVRRMLADPKAEALVENFAVQWLQLRNLAAMEPDRQRYRNWSDELRADMLTETKQFFAGVVREDCSVLELIDADYTYVNQRLARHYGLYNVLGDEFRRVKLDGSSRGGVLTMASVLAVTSNPTRTSPVKRGKWIMETILGTPPPDPPADVPDLDETAKVNPNVSLREQLEIHRRDVRCAACHRQMDALGLAMENFDPIGSWRDRDGRFEINATGKLPNGQNFSGPAELKQSLLSAQKGDFVRCLTEKLLTYSLGRGVEYYDRCTVDAIAAAAEKDGYKFSRFVIEIVESDPFQKRKSM